MSTRNGAGAGQSVGATRTALAGTEIAGASDSARTTLAERARAPSSAVSRLLDPEVTSPWHRYEDLGLLGRGGMGEVRLVRDRILGRELAMKLLPPEAAETPDARARFLAEARLTAQLSHPGIVPLHDCGALPDGVLWFTMTRVRGRTLAEVITEHHAAPGGPTPEARSRLVDVFARICEAVAYAHGEGVLHRDLKPANVMIGPFGEVLVMDWGIARAVAPGAPEAGLADAGGHGTLAGQILGTLAYMPPEQARGDGARLGPTCDVYSLGTILYEILCGTRPYSGTPKAVWAQLVAGPPEPLTVRSRGLPEDLVTLCERAMARDPGDRPPHAGALAEEVRRVQDGARRRERARAMVSDARARTPVIEALRARARALHAEARGALARIPLFAPEEEKAPAWAVQDEARALDRAAARETAAWQEQLRAALLEAPDLEEAHDTLAEAHRAELLAAEESGDAEGAARAEQLLAAHAGRGRASFLQEDGALTLVTDPEGAEVWLLRHVEERRRLRIQPVCHLGRTPLLAVSLPRGSYLLLIRAPGRREVRYPVLIGRGEHWSGVRPGSDSPHVVPLLPDHALGEGDVYVPPGWFVSGGDPAASESLPRRRLWADGLVAKRHPVTQAEFLSFLNDLVRTGRAPEAEAACPRAGGAMTGTVDVPLFARGEAGQFTLAAGSPADQAHVPVTSVSWHGAAAFAAWAAARTGLPWRLPGEQEREKLARGADGRFFPWGDEPETTWANMVSSRPGAASLAPVEAFPIDESPHGIRGLAGNVRDWCAERWTPEGPESPGDIVVVNTAAPDDPALRSIRGGAWSSAPPAMCRAAGRFAARPEERFRAVGLRLVRSL